MSTRSNMSKSTASTLPRVAGATTVVLAGGTLFTGGQVAHAATTVTNETELRDAIQAANDNGPGLDEIVIDAAEIALSTNLPAIQSSVTITGRGADQTVLSVSGTNVFYLSRADLSGVDSRAITVSGLTITGAYAAFNLDGRGGVFGPGSGVDDSLTVTDVNISDGDRDIIANGIETVTLTNVAITRSKDTFIWGGRGGGVYVSANVNGSIPDVTMTNVTVSGAPIVLQNTGDVALDQVTVSDVVIGDEFGDGIIVKTDIYATGSTVTMSDVSVSEIGYLFGSGITVENRADTAWTGVFSGITVSDVASTGLEVTAHGSITVTDSTISNTPNGISLINLRDSDWDGPWWPESGNGNPDWFPDWNVTIDNVHVSYADWTGISTSFYDIWSNPQNAVSSVSISNSSVTGYLVGIDASGSGSMDVTVTNSTISGAAYTGNYPSGLSMYGIGIRTYAADLSVVNSTITGKGGEGILAVGQAVLTQYCPPVGDCLYALKDDTPSSVSVSHSTITGNVGAGVRAFGYSADRYQNGQNEVFEAGIDVTVSHSVVSGNALEDFERNGEVYVGADVVSDSPVSVTWSLIDSDSAHAGGDNVANDDPMLGALADNGGSTLTMKPETGSPVIDAGNPAITGAPEFDQRGDSRIQGTIDIGAVEVAGPASAIAMPDGSGTNPASVAPGGRFKAKAACKSGEKVRFSFRGSSKDADCTSSTAGFGRPAVAGFDGFAEVEFTAPTEPGPYEVEVFLIGSNATYSIPVVVGAATTTTTAPTTTVNPVSSLPATGGGDRSAPVAWAAAMLVGLGAALSRLTRRRTA